MNKLFLIIIFFALPFSTKSQDYLFNFKLNKTMQFYYHKINLAENMLIKGEIEKSTLYYDSAFSNIKKPFAKDIYNAFVANINTSNDIKALLLYKQLLNLGLKESYLLKDEKTAAFLNKYTKVLKSYKPQTAFNKQLIDTLNTLYKIDQFHRTDYAKYKAEIKTDDSTCGINLLNIIKQFGFPDDYSIGIETESIIDHHFYYIIWHQGTSRQTNFSKVLLDAVNDGKIEAHIAASLIDKYYGSPVFSTEGITQIKYEKENIDSCCYVLDFNKVSKNRQAQISQYNQMRIMIGIESLEENQRKVIFKYTITPYIFPQYYWGGYNLYKVDSKEFFKQYPFDKMKNIKNDINSK
jgi:hypothetical protein